MYKLGKESIKNLSSCHRDIQVLFYTAIKDSPIDFSIVCGHRGEKEQNEAYAKGYSKLKYPDSKHNKTPAMAVDVVPYPAKWNASEREWKLLSEHIKKTALRLKINVKWGGDWKSFIDKPHWEL